MSENRGSLAPNRQLGRFTLTDLVDERYGCQVWRGTDSTLNRQVGLWLVPYEEDLAADLQEATKTAATVDDRRIVRILDVFTADDRVAVVTEWAPGEVLRDHLAEPLPPGEAARIAYEVSGAIASAHARGIAHGRLRPSNIVIGDDGEVRVTGLGIDAVLAGIDPVAGDDPVRADVHGIGAILYAGLTGRWPDGEADGVPAAPDVADHTPPPSRLVADIPEPLDDLCSRTVLTVASARDRPAPDSAAQTHQMLGGMLTDLTGQRRPYPAERTSRPSALVRVAAGVGVLVVVLGLGWLGWRILGEEAEPVTAPGPSASAAPSASAQPSERPPKSTRYRIVDAQDFDPLGSGEENRELVPLAYDGDLTTAWRTVTYLQKSLDNKPGLGLLLDLGAPRSIGRVTLNLVGNGTDLQVLTSNEPTEDPQDYDLMAQATEAGERVVLKSPRPASARYVLIWFTSLPQADGGWRGGIREVRVGS